MQGSDADTHRLAPSPSTRGSPLVDSNLDRLKLQLGRLQRSVRLVIEQALGEFSGRSFGSFEANHEMASTIHDLLDGHGLRVRCPECGHPAILRCGNRPGIPEGVFVYDHAIDGRRTFHGGATTFPAIRLVAKPPRRRPGTGAAGGKLEASHSES